MLSCSEDNLNPSKVDQSKFNNEHNKQDSCTTTLKIALLSPGTSWNIVNDLSR